jgi:hypothetical protein
MNDSTTPSLWNLPANPVFQRYAASRLRPIRLAVWVVLSHLITGFFWAVTLLIYLNVQRTSESLPDLKTLELKALFDLNRETACVFGWLVVLTVQGAIVIWKGTFSVATGVAREANEGMMESIDLTPLSPAHKAIGQLLGLPLLETLVAVSLIPWAILSAYLGGLSPVMMGKVYLLFATSTLFHHAIGLVAGTLIRQKILAGTFSQLCILLLHIVLPLLGGLGVGVISHLGMESAILVLITQATPSVHEYFQSSNLALATVQFFGWEIGLAGYNWLITASSLGILLFVLLRRWHDRESLLLGKIGTVFVAGWILTISCGEIIPSLPDLVNSATNLKAGAISENFKLNFKQDPLGTICWFGIVIGILNLILVSLLIPSLSRRLTAAKERWWEDGREALPWVLGISMMSVAAWFLVIHSIRQINASGLANFDIVTGIRLSFSIIIPAVTWYLLVLWQGWKKALGIGFLVGVLPLMVVILGTLVSSSTSGWPKWVAATSILVMPGYASSHCVLPAPGSDSDTSSAFLISASMHMAVAIFMFHSARRMLRLR